MLNKNNFLEEYWEALLDEELSHEEKNNLDSLPSDDVLHRLSQENDIIRHHLKTHVEQVTESVDFDAFFTELDAKLTEQTTPSSQTTTALTTTESWFDKLRAFFSSHPSIPFACASAIILAIVFAIPFLDPGPSSDNHVVEKVTNNKSSQVAILQTKDKKSERKITAVDLNVSATTTEDNDKNNNKNKKTKQQEPSSHAPDKEKP